MPWNSNKEGNSSDGGDDDECTARALYEALNLVREPSMIRVESDELTYTLHVLLRYELERALVDGSLKVADVPKAWNEKMVAYLGCEPESDARGVLQDVHWSAGALGYFPTYSLGAMFACQIFQAAKESIGAEELDAQLRNGEFSVLREWLRERVHLLGSLPVSGDELMKRVTGRPLDPQVFLRYLSDKYRTLYKC
jgi:Zn-dependent M32 family carboxypeptidase